MNDLWDSMDVRDDKFSLISEMNREVDIFVKTPVGDSEVFTVKSNKGQYWPHLSVPIRWIPLQESVWQMGWRCSSIEMQ